MSKQEQKELKELQELVAPLTTNPFCYIPQEYPKVKQYVPPYPTEKTK